MMKAACYYGHACFRPTNDAVRVIPQQCTEPRKRLASLSSTAAQARPRGCATLRRVMRYTHHGAVEQKLLLGVFLAGFFA